MKSKAIQRVLLIVLALLLIVALLAAVAWHFLNDAAFVKKQLSSRLTTSTGWQLEISGDLTFNWGRNTEIGIRNLRLSNPHFSAQPELIRAGQLRLVLQPLELLHNNLLINQLEATDCQVHYVEDAEGIANWTMLADNHGNEPHPRPEAESKFSWAVQQLDISSCKLDVISSGHQQPVQIRLNQARLSVDEKENLTAAMDGELDRHAMSLQGNVSPLAALWKGGKLQHEIQLQAGNIKLHSEGSFEEFRSGDGANLTFRFTGPEFAEVTQWLALPDISSGAFDARLDLKEQADSGNMNITVDADLGSMEIMAAGQLDRIVKPAVGKIDMQVTGPDLDALARTFGQHGLVADPYELQLKAAIEDSKTDLQLLSLSTATDRIQLQGTLGPWPTLLDSQIAISLHSPDLSAWLPPGKGALPFSSLDSEISLSYTKPGKIKLQATGELGRFAEAELPFTLQTDLLQQDPQWQLQQLDLQMGQDRLSLSGKLNLLQAFQNSEIDTQLQLADLAATARTFGLPDLPSQPLKITARLSRSGDGVKFKTIDSDLGGLNIHMSGTVPDIHQPLVMSSHFDLDLPSLELARFLFPDLPLPDLPFSIRGEFSPTGSRQIRLQDVALGLGQTKAKINAQLDLSKQLLGSSADISVNGPDLHELWPQAPEALDFGHFSLTGKWQRQSEGDFFKAVKFNSALGSVDFSAQVDNLMKPQHIDVSVDLNSPDASRFNDLLGPVFDNQALKLSFTASGMPTHFSSPGLSLQQGKNRLTAELEFTSVARPGLSGNVNATLVDLVPFQQHISASEQSGPEQSGPEKSRPEQSGPQTRKMLFSQQAVNFLGISPLDLSLEIQADRVLVLNNELERLKLVFDLQQQSLEVRSLSFDGHQGGHYSAQASGYQSGQVTDFRVLAQAHDLKLGMLGVAGQDPASLPSSDLELDLSGSGHSWHDLAGSLAGKMRWYTGPGQVSNTGFNFIFSDLVTQIFSTLNPLSRKSQFTRLSCGVYAADFINGQVRLAPVVIQTEQITAFSEGTIDLDTEEINLNFRTMARKGLGLSAGNVVNPFFRIGGTLMKPALQLNLTKGAISGGAMVATAGLSVLFKSLSDRLLASEDPCGDARKAIEQRDSVVGKH